MVIPILILLIVLCVAALAMLVRANRALKLEAANRKSDLDRTSKILIEKNLELVDQTILQQKMLETKDDFINIVSHQLRTPVTEIKWSIDSILKDKTWKLEAAQKQSLEVLYSSIEHMVRLIDNIVHLVIVEQGAQQLAVMAYSADDVVRAAVERIAKNFPPKHIAWSVETTCSDQIRSIDSESLNMVVSNIVENAFFYTPQGGKLTVHTGCTEKGVYQITISDNGMGMSTDQQKSVFKKFRRGSGAIVANARGSGLGLYIVKKILEQHKGDVSFESVEHTGTIFTITLPHTE